jgi:RNA polymerase sigma factor (sigma-70 family)
MDLNTLYKQALENDKKSEGRLFQHLMVSFRMFTHRNIQNQQDIEEIVQNALKIVAENYKDIEIHTNFAGWTYKVLKNQILNYYRTKKLPRNQAVELTENISNPKKEVGIDLKKRLTECLRKLNSRNTIYARILNLHYLGYTTAEICRKLQINERVLYTSIYRARQMLLKCLEKGKIK